MEQPTDTPWYCVDCGVRLKVEHDYCWNCGAKRWLPPAATVTEPGRQSTPDSTPAGTAPRAPAPPAARSGTTLVPGLGGLKLFFAVWGVLLMIWATYSLARVLSPVGRADLIQQVAGVPADQTVAIQYGVIIGAVALAVLHAIAFHGISRRQVSGWLVGVVVAGLWSIVLIGIPALWVLLLRTTREAFGLA